MGTQHVLDRGDFDVGDAQTRREVEVLGHDDVEDLPGKVDQVHLVDGDPQTRDPHKRRHEEMPPRLGQEPRRASIRMTARLAVEAPVTMLHVYCSWPGVSAMMKCRRAVVK